MFLMHVVVEGLMQQDFCAGPDGCMFFACVTGLVAAGVHTGSDDVSVSDMGAVTLKQQDFPSDLMMRPNFERSGPARHKDNDVSLSLSLSLSLSDARVGP